MIDARQPRYSAGIAARHAGLARGRIDLAAIEEGGRIGNRERATMELVRETIRLRTVAEAMLDEVRKANEAAAARQR